MFYILHRIYVFSWTTLIIGAIVWLYPRTGVSEAVRDWNAVLLNRSEVSARPIGEISGKVIKVLDGGSFTLRTAEPQLFNIALLGVVPPPFTPNSALGELAQQSKERLSQLILSNEVQVTLTWMDPQRRGVGIVHLGRTNVNAAMVESGLVHFKRKLIKGLPLLDQYALVRAEREARERLAASQN